jgi:hypothetical protein
MVNVTVWHFVSDTHKVWPHSLLLCLFWFHWNWFAGSYLQGVILGFSLQSHRYFVAWKPCQVDFGSLHLILCYSLQARKFWWTLDGTAVFHCWQLNFVVLQNQGWSSKSASFNDALSGVFSSLKVPSLLERDIVDLVQRRPISPGVQVVDSFCQYCKNLCEVSGESVDLLCLQTVNSIASALWYRTHSHPMDDFVASGLRGRFESEF